MSNSVEKMCNVINVDDLYYLDIDELSLKEEIEKNRKDINKCSINLKVLPHPFWGNIENANIVFVAMYPFFNNLDLIEIQEYIKKYSLKDFFDVAIKQDWLKGNYDQLFSNTYAWWAKKIFDKIKLRDEYKDSVLAYVNLFPYQIVSRVKSLPKLKSTELLYNFLKNSIFTDENKIIIVICGLPKLREMFKGDYDVMKRLDSMHNIAVVNSKENGYSNLQIYNALKNDSSYNLLLKKIFEKK